MQILNSFQSQHLLLIAAVSRRFRDLATDLIYGRLLLATTLQDHELLLECYHPTNQYTEPYLFCKSLDTPQWPGEIQSSTLRGEARSGEDRFKMISTLYSSFKPIRADTDRPYFTKSISNDLDIDNPSIAPGVDLAKSEDELMTRTVNLDNCELFSQLCISVVLVQVGPRRGVFLSCIDILKKKTTRIWRQWLLKNSSDSDNNGSQSIIWADQKRNVGLKVRVQEIRGRHHVPILQLIDENQAISYKLELEGVSEVSF